jgi:hypothetical protein
LPIEDGKVNTKANKDMKFKMEEFKVEDWVKEIKI